MRPPLLAFAFVIITGCSNNLPKQSIVDKLRVLAVQANPAELVIGDSLPATTLTALAIEPSGAPIELRWALCPLPANTPPPASLDCPGQYGIALMEDASGVAQLDLGDPSAQPFWDVLYRTPDGTPLTDGQRVSILASGTTAVAGFAATAGGEELDGFAEIPLRGAGAPINRNPSLTGLLVNGALLPADGSSVLAAGVKVRLQPVPASDAKEDTGNGLEALNFSFFATEGDIASLRSTDQTSTGEPADSSIDYTAPTTAGSVQFWVVVRDGRGGVGWITRTALVR
jgi:hypothetical protein